MIQKSRFASLLSAVLAVSMIAGCGSSSAAQSAAETTAAAAETTEAASTDALDPAVPSESSESTSEETGSYIYNLGSDIPAIDGIRFELMSVNDHDPSGEAEPMLLCHVRIKNTSAEGLEVNTGDFSATCDGTPAEEYTEYERDEENGMKRWYQLDVMEGTVAPGESKEAGLVFRVPDSYKIFQITYSPSEWKGQSVTIEWENYR
ncbi:MAG: DUF4352 domain-containing protein [Bulleidia sp.]|nr:DUF4352 domain-containing protein [Bulleidia sp.]